MARGRVRERGANVGEIDAATPYMATCISWVHTMVNRAYHLTTSAAVIFWPQLDDEHCTARIFVSVGLGINGPDSDTPELWNNVVPRFIIQAGQPFARL